MNTQFGTRAWGRRRDGRLTRAEQWGFALQAVRPLLLRAFSRRRRPLPELSQDFRPPDSAACRRADAVMIEASPPWLIQHCYRCYAFGRVLAVRDGLKFDDELFYSASLLHDLGVTARFLPPAGRCFALYGADVAERTLRDAGMPEKRAAAVAEAIALHLNLSVDLRPHGPEAHLLRAATAMDVTGQNARALGRQMRQAILERYPRLDVKDGLCAVMTLQAERSPTTRVGFLVRKLRVLDLVRSAPLP
jgi:hypothetical protein